MAYRDFTQTSVWQKALNLLIVVYAIAKKFPKEELYVLSSDMKRAANSVAHNFAEGFGRFESRDKTRFYKIARGSAYELISQTIVALRLAYLNEEEKDSLFFGYTQVIYELDTLIKSIERR